MGPARERSLDDDELCADSKLLTAPDARQCFEISGSARGQQSLAAPRTKVGASIVQTHIGVGQPPTQRRNLNSRQVHAHACVCGRRGRGRGLAVGTRARSIEHRASSNLPLASTYLLQYCPCPPQPQMADARTQPPTQLKRHRTEDKNTCTHVARRRILWPASVNSVTSEPRAGKILGKRLHTGGPPPPLPRPTSPHRPREGRNVRGGRRQREIVGADQLQLPSVTVSVSGFRHVL